MTGLAFANISGSVVKPFPATQFRPFYAQGKRPGSHVLTFSVEDWRDIRGVVYPMWHRHHAEIAKDGDLVPLDPDWDRYDAYDDCGALHLTIARDRDGEMVGYVFALISPHLHYRSTLCAFLDLYWLEPRVRKGWNGVKLFRAMESGLKDCGVRKIYGQTKVWQDASIIFQRLGWTEAERAFTKWIA